jgi:hypothetical protein
VPRRGSPEESWPELQRAIEDFALGSGIAS